MKLWFGKYRDVEMSDIPASYLLWLIDNMGRESIRDLARDELQRRTDSERRPIRTPLSDPVTAEIIQAGYRALAQQAHPQIQ